MLYYIPYMVYNDTCAWTPNSILCTSYGCKYVHLMGASFKLCVSDCVSDCVCVCLVVCLIVCVSDCVSASVCL